jgi:ribulose-phosphate 3-epimerase
MEMLEPLLDQIELVLLLTINPGWGGQKIGTETPRRVEQARRLIDDSGREILLGVDGGITRRNIVDVAKLRPDLIVTGSAVFDGGAPEENARYMLGAISAALAETA